MASLVDDLKREYRSGNIVTQLVLINAALFLGYNIIKVFVWLFQAQGIFLIDGGPYDLISWLLMMPPQPLKLLTRPWTLVTYGFFHQGFFHILFNMLWLYWFGRVFTDFLGQKKLLDVYILGAIAGGLLYFLSYNILPVINQTTGGPLLGASGAVYAVIVATAVLAPDFTFNLFLLGPVKLKYIAAVSVVLSFIAIAGGNPGGNLAHMGGALMGYLYMTQLRQGNDWGKPIRYVYDGIRGLFDPKSPKMTVHRGSSTKNKTTNYYSASRKSSSSNVSEDEIDAILDKINKSGYESLSKEEKQKLYNASKSD